MYTIATKNFGIWRSDHFSHKFYKNRSVSFLGAALFLNFISIVIVFVLYNSIKIKSYYFEIFGPSIPQFDQVEGLYEQDSQASFALSVVPTSGKVLRVTTNDGQIFTIPDELDEFKFFLDAKARNIFYTAALLMNEKIKLGKIQLWLSKDLSLERVNDLLKLFSDLGFDDFDIAVQVVCSEITCPETKAL
jgi:hypothetical protein